jgi:hypothetical protein
MFARRQPTWLPADLADSRHDASRRGGQPLQPAVTIASLYKERQFLDRGLFRIRNVVNWVLVI